MRKFLSIVIGIALLGLLGTSVYAKSEKAKGFHEKATGEVVAYSGSTRIDLSFNAHNTDITKGYAYYENSTGKYFYGDVDVCYEQDIDKAAFVGTVQGGNYPPNSKYFKIEVWDKGEGENSEKDSIRVRLFVEKPDCKISNVWGATISEGNLQVHKAVQED